MTRTVHSVIGIGKSTLTFFIVPKKMLHVAGEKNTETLERYTRAQRNGFSAPAFILIIQQHTSDNAAQMPELQTQVLGGLVLIAANWCSNTSRHICSVCITVRTKGIVKCFSARTLRLSRSSVLHYQSSVLRTQKMRICQN